MTRPDPTLSTVAPRLARARDHYLKTTKPKKGNK